MPSQEAVTVTTTAALITTPTGRIWMQNRGAVPVYFGVTVDTSPTTGHELHPGEFFECITGPTVGWWACTASGTATLSVSKA